MQENTIPKKPRIYKFSEEINELLQVPRLVFVVLAYLIGFVKLDRSQYFKMLEELNGEWTNYFLLMSSWNTFKGEPKLNRAAKLALSYGLIRKELKENLALEPRKINLFLKDLKETNSKNILESVQNNPECTALFKEVERSFKDYQLREDGFYKEFEEISSANIKYYGWYFLSERLNKMRYFN